MKCFSARALYACVVVLAFFGTEEDSLWPTIYVCAILMKEVFDRRFMIVRFVLKHRKYWFRHRKLYVSLNDDFDFDVKQQHDQSTTPTTMSTTKRCLKLRWALSQTRREIKYTSLESFVTNFLIESSTGLIVSFTSKRAAAAVVIIYLQPLRIIISDKG